MKITPSQLYDYYQCPHKIWQDTYGSQAEKIQETNPFVQLLWDKGIQHENKVITKLYGSYLDLSVGSKEERVQQTQQALEKKVKLMYQPVLSTEELYGIPDLLELQDDGNYLPIDIKSGQGFEGQSEGVDEQKQKKHYALQLCLYVDMLQTMGYCNARSGYIIDGDGNKVRYELDRSMSTKVPQTYWEYYQEALSNVKDLISGKLVNEPALAGICKLCSWYNACKKWCVENDDPTQLFYLGRSVRDRLKTEANVLTVADVAVMDVQQMLDKKKKDKTYLKGVGEGTLNSVRKRADMFQKKSPPVAYSAISLPTVQYELFFDIEDDPTQDFVYLHGIYVRENGKEYFKEFVADHISEEAEAEAWKNFWHFIDFLPKDNFAVYYYSQHEKTTYFKLQKKYSDIISEENLTAFFAHPNVIDLYGIVLKQTDWPLGSYSIKALATYLGFTWRDESPSGALSIQWFNDYIRDRDPKQLQRILEYNEDDCKATMVLKDKLATM